MTVTVHLDPMSISKAIRKLHEAQNELTQSVGDLVDTLLIDGADVANDAYEGMATAVGQRDSEEDGVITGHIGVSGADDTTVIIAEFGAGDATEENSFENDIPGIEVYAGEYSKKVGTGEYARSLEKNGDTGTWHYMGEPFNEIKPKRGLAKAKAFIVVSTNDFAEEMIHL